MAAPALVLAQSSSLKFDIPSTNSAVTHNRNSASRVPLPSIPPSRYSSIVEQGRASSETAIFSIYSMYGDQQQSARSSWAAAPSLSRNDRKTKDQLDSRTKDPTIPVVNLSLPDNPRESFFDSNAFESSLAYYDPSQDAAVHLSSPDFEKSGKLNELNGFSHSSYPSTSRPPSATSSSLRASPVLPDIQSVSMGNHCRISDLTASSHTSTPTSITTSPISRQSWQNSSFSHTRHSTLSMRELPPLPPSSTTTPSPTPPPRESPTVLAAKPSPQLSSKPKGSYPASMTSNVPSEGEDVDAFHVRSTYAQLEMSGVKGDGYVEGVERTRARVGVSRTSQANAAAAIGDGNEKNRDLDPQEVEVLASVDRYGFFTVPSHDRLILLQSAPLVKRLARTPAGPPTASTSAISLKSLPSVSVPPKEAPRIAKWTRMLQPLSRDHGGNVEAWTIKPSKEHKLRERTYKGIPDRWRAAAWDLLMSRYAKTGHRDLARLGEDYRDALDKPSSYDVQIDLDVPRTISGHIMFKTRYGAGQRSLFHVLHSFSLVCSSCGYVQGMGPIAATLLCYFDPERVYASLVRLHTAYNMHSVFNPGFPGLLEAIYVQERIMETMMPDVYTAFKKHMISTTSYATKWYITLFSNSVPFQTQLRLWDAFLLDGYDVFVAMAVAIVWAYRDQITATAASFETVLSLLSSFFVPEDENVLLSWIEKTLGDKKIKANINKWRLDWKELVKTGKDGTVLL